MTDMIQCLLTRGEERYTAWLPARYARTGRCVDIKVDDDWQQGWKVAEVYSSADEGTVKILRDQYRYTRIRTDVPRGTDDEGHRKLPPRSGKSVG